MIIANSTFVAWRTRGSRRRPSYRPASPGPTGTGDIAIYWGDKSGSPGTPDVLKVGVGGSFALDDHDGDGDLDAYSLTGGTVFAHIQDGGIFTKHLNKMIS